MAQLSRVEDGFGEVNVFMKEGGAIEIVATILATPDIEGAKVALALDASISMEKYYGISNIVNPILQQAAKPKNVVEPIARAMAQLLAQFSCDDSVEVIYWSCGTDGSQVEPVGMFSADAAESIAVAGPKSKKMGRQTQLLPPVKYFVEEAMADAPWGIAVLITDGKWNDMQQVKDYSMQFARQVAGGSRKFIKLVLVGVCTGEDEDTMRQYMEELDDMFEGSGLNDPEGNTIDLWDHKIAKNINRLEEVFAEVVTKNAPLAPSGRILDAAGGVVVQYPNDDSPAGLPGLLRFTLPSGSASFSLEVAGATITQDITEGLDRI